MKVRVMCMNFECREGIHYKTPTGSSCEKCNWITGLVIQRTWVREGHGVAFSATGHGLGLIMYICTTLKNYKICLEKSRVSEPLIPYTKSSKVSLHYKG